MKQQHASCISITSAPMRFAIYARKSTESEDRQVQSLDDQIRELTHLAKREGHHVTEIFQESRSAKAPGNRPEFDRLIQEVEEGAFEGILTWSINRLSRNPVDGGRIAYLLQTGKLSMIRTIERSYVPEDNALLLSIENGMATAYLQDLSRNVKRGMQGKFERGWLPAKAPLGYRNDLETHEILPDPESFVALRSAWDRLLTGEYSFREVVIYAQQLGVSAHRRNRPRTIASESALYGVFRHPFYCGRICFNGQERVGKHQPMVSEEEFEQAQVILAERGRPTRKRRLDFPFQGTLKCAVCGCVVLGERKFKTYRNTNRSVEYVYYHCTGSKGCSKAGIRQEELVQTMTTLAQQVRIPEAVSDWLRRTAPVVIERRSETKLQDHPEAARQLEREELRLDALVTMRADREIGQDEFARSREQILTRIKALKAEDRQHRIQPTRLLKRLNGLLEAGAMARELSSDRPCVRASAALLQELGGGLFHSGSLQISLHPALQKIVTFEPPNVSSGRSKGHDVLDSIPGWLAFVEEVLNLLDDPDAQHGMARLGDVRELRTSKSDTMFSSLQTSLELERVVSATPEAELERRPAARSAPIATARSESHGRPADGHTPGTRSEDRSGSPRSRSSPSASNVLTRRFAQDPLRQEVPEPA